MTKWWNGMNAFEHVYFIIACIATVALIVQVILLLAGLHDGDLDFDGDTDFDADAGGGLSLFTIKGLIAFFAIGGWVGLIVSTSGGHVAVAVLGSIAAGAAALFGVGFVLRAMYRMTSQGNLDYGNAVGKTATVYVTVPADMDGRGKITLMLQGKFSEIDAMTRESQPIHTDAPVEVLEVMGDVLIVRPLRAEKERSEESAAPETAE